MTFRIPETRWTRELIAIFRIVGRRPYAYVAFCESGVAVVGVEIGHDWTHLYPDETPFAVRVFDARPALA